MQLIALFTACAPAPAPPPPPAPEPVVVEEPAPPPVWPDPALELLTLPVPPADTAQATRPRIFVVAGHGSAGNIGNTGVRCQQEQDFTLRVADALAAYLDETGWFEVRRARKGDERPAYSSRKAAAEAWSADALVEIHSDARGAEAYWWSPDGEQQCLRNDQDPGFSVLWSDDGEVALVEARHHLARSLAARLVQSGFRPTPGDNYVGLYEGDADQAGVFVDRHAPGQRIFMLRRPTIPSVIVETHNAIDLPEVTRWDEEHTVESFSAAIAVGLLDALP